MRTKGYNCGVNRLTAAIALCAISTALQAAEVQGSLTVFGSVQVEGVAAPTGTTLFAGQTVSTARDSRALLTLARGANISLSPSATVTVESSSVTLLAGSGSLKGGPGTVLMAGQLRLEPDSAHSVVTASLLEKGRVNVAVSSGGAVVTDPTGVTLAKLLPGQALLFGLSAQEQGRPRSGGQAPGLPEGQKDEKKPDSTKPPASTPSKGSSKTAIYVLIGAGAAGGIAAAALGGSKRGS